MDNSVNNVLGQSIQDSDNNNSALEEKKEAINIIIKEGALRAIKWYKKRHPELELTQSKYYIDSIIEEYNLQNPKESLRNSSNNTLSYNSKKIRKRYLEIFLFTIIAIILLELLNYIFNNKSDNSSLYQPIDKPTDIKSIATVDDRISLAQEAQAKIDFLEDFYIGLLKSDFSDTYIIKFITPNAKKVLNDNYDYDCEGDCLAVWLFAYEAGLDLDPENEFRSRKISKIDENNFLVEIDYEHYKHRVILSVIKTGDGFKIDNLERTYN